MSPEIMKKKIDYILPNSKKTQPTTKQPHRHKLNSDKIIQKQHRLKLVSNNTTDDSDIRHFRVPNPRALQS